MANAGDTTYESLWKRILLYYPTLSPILAQEFVNTAYSRILGSYQWSALRMDSEFYVNAPYNTGTASVTLNSTSVTGNATAWTSAMVGREFYTGGQAPFFTIEAIDVPTQTLTLDRVYSKVSDAAAAYSIENIYLVCPSDFNGFLAVRDLLNNWRLHLKFKQEQLDIWDPKRSISGTPWILVNTWPNSAGRMRYEIWPRATSTRTYPFRYLKKPALMSNNNDRPILPIRGDVIREGALAELALFPGVPSDPNPLYDQGLSIWKAREQRFQDLRAAMELEDQLINQTNVNYEDLHTIPYAPIDARYLQTHDTPF